MHPKFKFCILVDENKWYTNKQIHLRENVYMRNY